MLKVNYCLAREWGQVSSLAGGLAPAAEWESKDTFLNHDDISELGVYDMRRGPRVLGLKSC